MPSEQPLLSNEVPELIAIAQLVELAFEDSLRAKEQVSFPDHPLVEHLKEMQFFVICCLTFQVCLAVLVFFNLHGSLF